MVSVIVPNYNHAAFLKKRIDSVLHQTYTDLEIILLDDCSTDNSKTIIEQYQQHPRVNQILYNEVNSGSAFQQWKKGIELAKGEWIWIAESDDFAHENFLAQLISNTNKSSNIVLSYCQSNEIDESNTVLGTMQWWTNDVDTQHWSVDYINNGTHETGNYLSYKNTIPNASAVIFKKAAYMHVDDEYTKMQYCGDWLLWIKILKAGDVAYTAQPLNFFRKHAATTRTLNSSDKLRKRLEEEFYMLQYIRENIGLSKLEFRERLKRIMVLFSHVFTKKQIVKLIFNPSAYKGPIPLFSVLINYFSTRLRDLFERGIN